MMIPIKVECGCGQRYAFEAEGELPAGSIACPTCGSDGTAAANAIIVERLAAQPAPPPAPPVRARIQIATPTAAARPAGSGPPSRPGIGGAPPSEHDLAQAEIEAKAKILWGDASEDVVKFLIFRGFTRQEATEKVGLLFKERYAEVRANGFGKIIKGILFTLGSGALFLLLVAAHFISLWLLAASAMGCVFGLWTILNGVIKVLAPKSEQGDVAEND